MSCRNTVLRTSAALTCDSTSQQAIITGFCRSFQQLCTERHVNHVDRRFVWGSVPSQLTHQVCAAACDATVNDLSIVVDGSVADLQAHMATSCSAHDSTTSSTMYVLDRGTTLLAWLDRTVPTSCSQMACIDSQLPAWAHLWSKGHMHLLIDVPQGHLSLPAWCCENSDLAQLTWI